MPRLVHTTLALAIGAATLVGCTSSAPGPQVADAPSGQVRVPATPSKTRAVPVGPPITASGPVTVRPTGTATPTNPALPAPRADCAVTLTGQQIGGTTHAGLVVVLRSKGTHSCALVGFPGVTAHDAAGKKVATARRTTSGYYAGPAGEGPEHPPALVGPGAAASLLVEWVTKGSGGASCPAVTELRVTLPGSSDAARLPVKAPMCDLEVHAVVTGTSGGR